LGVTVQHLLEALAAANIEARPVWKPLHLQPLYKGTRFYAHDHGEPVCETLFNSGICLPSGSNMSTLEQVRVIDCMKDVFEKASCGSAQTA
jgi:pyridoxal phosphate-dependent aminotransferase EpsN